MDQDKKDKDELKIMNKKLAQSLENVSVHLSEIMKKVLNLTVLVQDNVQEISRLKEENKQLKSHVERIDNDVEMCMYEQSSAKAEISKLKSHTSDRAIVPQLVRVVGVDPFEDGDTDVDGDEDNVPHFVDYRSETLCGGAQAAAPTDAVLDPVPSPAPAPAPAPAPSRAPEAASDIINGPVYLSAGHPVLTTVSLDDQNVPSAEQDYANALNHATIQENFDRLNKFKEQMLNEKLNRCIIISNIILNKQEIHTIRSNFWLNIKKLLSWLSLDFILYESKGVKLFKSGCIRIEYPDVWTAKNAIAKIIRHIKWLRQRREDLSDREEIALKIKFTRCTPPKFNQQRRVLSKIGNEMKKNKEIQFFDFAIINSRLILKTYNKDNGYRFYDENGPAGIPGRDERIIYNQNHSGTNPQTWNLAATRERELTEQ